MQGSIFLGSWNFTPSGFFPKIPNAPFLFNLNRKEALFSFWEFFSASKIGPTNFGNSIMCQGDQKYIVLYFFSFYSLSSLYFCLMFCFKNSKGLCPLLFFSKNFPKHLFYLFLNRKVYCLQWGNCSLHAKLIKSILDV